MRAFTILVVICFASIALGGEKSSTRFPSPDGRFALRVSEDLKADLIERASGKVVLDLLEVLERYRNHPEETFLVWSADSKWVAYGTRGEREGDTTVYYWNGTEFKGVPLPEDLPGPNIKFPKGTNDVKNYGGTIKPLRWLKNGDLELSSDSEMMSRDDGATYTGVVVITLKFDAQHRASVRKVGKTKTTVE